jgi:hypothetical protein
MLLELFNDGKTKAELEFNLFLPKKSEGKLKSSNAPSTNEEK